ncbi:hypothetical protein IUY40_05580 [Flavobacterium sp. ALJ2]|uniref:hypothetical protein n=1 Tax=Flavobacterium sp. ALJ2 TaxID=2786960 RepID=UPI00189E2FF4|nr:hypothetical protein [Flavobacterium sp. ALJ2]MBF7091004.1 hypothetical protein [Flavobacterium sp. ALJ2]
MKTNQEILDNYGKLVVNEIIDRQYKGVSKAIFQGLKNPTMQRYNKIFDKLNQEEKELLKSFIYENTNSLVFDFLRIFEENDEYKLVYEEEGKQVNLVEISEMLKAEPIIENGWIERFSIEK